MIVVYFLLQSMKDDACYTFPWLSFRNLPQADIQNLDFYLIGYNEILLLCCEILAFVGMIEGGIFSPASMGDE